MSPFHIIDLKAPHGPTTYHEDPKIEAYKYAAMLQSQGYKTSMTFHEDGHITVESHGLMSQTFAPSR
jgi:hypothetical protein